MKCAGFEDQLQICFITNYTSSNIKHNIIWSTLKICVSCLPTQHFQAVLVDKYYYFYFYSLFEKNKLLIDLENWHTFWLGA